MKLIIFDDFAINSGDLNWKNFYNLPLEIEQYAYISREEQLQKIKNADLIIINKVLIDKELLDHAPKLKYIGIIATGTDNIDLAECAKRNIVVSNVPNYSSDSVAQLTISLLLQLCRSTSNYYNSVKDGYWRTNIPEEYNIAKQIELSNKTIGLIGYGDIAKSVCKIAIALNMKVLVYARTKRENTQDITFVDLEELLNRSDVISLHCPCTDETYEIINENTISKMKDEVILINTSRGRLVNETDLVKALNIGKIHAFGSDVLAVEPMEENSPFKKTPNTVITPHIAWATNEALERLMIITEKNLEMFLAGTPQNKVN